MAWSITCLAVPDLVFFLFFFLDGDVFPPRVVSSRGVLILVLMLILVFEAVFSKGPLGTVVAAEQLEWQVTRVAAASNSSCFVFAIVSLHYFSFSN